MIDRHAYWLVTSAHRPTFSVSLHTIHFAIFLFPLSEFHLKVNQNWEHIQRPPLSFWTARYNGGGGPRAVVSPAAFHARVRGSVPGLGGLKETKNVSSPSTCESQYCGELRDREVACSVSDRQSLNFESCVWRTVSSHSSHHPQEVLLAQFSLYVHKGGLKPDSFHFVTTASPVGPNNSLQFFVI